MTVDYCALNKQTKNDVYPLCRIDDLLDKLLHARVLSDIDLASGYHQVGLSKDALFEYMVLPLGLFRG